MASKQVGRWKVLVADGSDNGVTVYDGPNEALARGRFGGAVSLGLRAILSNDGYGPVLTPVCDCPAAVSVGAGAQRDAAELVAILLG